MSFLPNEVFALAAAPVLSLGLWGGAAGAGPVPLSSVTAAGAGAAAPHGIAGARRRPGILWIIFHNGGNGGGNNGNGGAGGNGPDGPGGDGGNGAGGAGGNGDWGGNGGWDGSRFWGGSKPDQPAYVSLRPVRSGQTVAFRVAGRRPGAPVYASLYGPDQDGRVQVAADFRPVIADRSGAATIRWTVTGKMAPGRYALLVESAGDAGKDCASSTCAGFEVDR